MARDRLLLLKAGFSDPAFPGQTFYCWHCALIEGVLASFPELAARIDVERIEWPRPRRAVVDLLGEENQSLPVLVLAASSESEGQETRAFLSDKDAILDALVDRHGFPRPHP